MLKDICKRGGGNLHRPLVYPTQPDPNKQGITQPI